MMAVGTPTEAAHRRIRSQSRSPNRRLEGITRRVIWVARCLLTLVLTWHLESFGRPFFWENVTISDLYSVVNVVLLPRPPHSPPSAASPKGLAAFVKAGIDPTAWTVSDSNIVVFSFIFPSKSGYASRSDFLHLRFQDCQYGVAHVHSNLGPRERYDAVKIGNVLPNLESAAGVIQWTPLSNTITIMALQQTLQGMNREVHARLNKAPWLYQKSPSDGRKRVALVRGRPNLTAGEHIYKAAAALGLDLVIVDEKGHWLQPDTPENRKLRRSFLVTDMAEDAGVADRIIRSIKNYPLPIHGIFTLSDNFFVTVARIAEALGLPCSPVSAFETSVDKYRSRLLQDSPGQTARVSSVAELETLLVAPPNGQRTLFTPTFPMIVKPTKGWSSECVSKVNRREDLATAVAKATTRHGSAAVIEPFFDGPEIDVNFVLHDGEILFCEIADEPPCQADASNATVNDTFSPEALTLPSALPVDEQEIARTTLRDILVKLGFRTGVFHVEARMVNSRYEYRDVGNGIIDLVPRLHALPDSKQPACRLLEINARPPGYRVTVPSKHTYGVDYFAAHMLAAVGDYDRLRLVANPYNHQLGTALTPLSGSQYWSRLVYIPVPAEGTVRFKSGLAPCDELKQRRPDLAKHIVLAVDYCQPGDKVSLFTDGARSYAAHLLVASTASRLEAIEIGNEVQRAFEMDIEAD